MKGFEEFAPFSQEKKAKIWNECVFVFDTNVLLNLYRYTKNTSEDLIQILKKLKERIWIPHQVGLEYNYNRLNQLIKQNISYEQISMEIDNSYSEFIKDLEKKLVTFNRHPLIDTKNILGKFEEALRQIKVEINKASDLHPKEYEEDSFYNIITELFNDKIGDNPYNQTALDELFQEGSRRYENSIPPGYKDVKDKKGNTRIWNDLTYKNEYGDLIVWKQILLHANEIKKPIIFIMDDNKSDWWQVVSGKTLGPRHELMREMFKETGKEFYMYRTHQFMKIAKEQFNKEIKSESIEEARHFEEIDSSDDYLLEFYREIKEKNKTKSELKKRNLEHFLEKNSGNSLTVNNGSWKFLIEFTVMKNMYYPEILNSIINLPFAVLIDNIVILPVRDKYEADQKISVYIFLTEFLTSDEVYKHIKNLLFFGLEDIITIN